MKLIEFKKHPFRYFQWDWLISYYSFNTVGSKIIRALEIVRVKKLISNIDLWNKCLLSYNPHVSYSLTSMRWLKPAIKSEKNSKYYRKYSNNFAADFKTFVIIFLPILFSIPYTLKKQRMKITQREKLRFIKVNELKLTQVELL